MKIHALIIKSVICFIVQKLKRQCRLGPGTDYDRIYFFKLSLISINNLSVEEGPGGGGGGSFFFILLIALTTKNRINAITINLMTADKNTPYFTEPQTNLSMSVAPMAFKAGVNNNGVITSSTKDEIIAANAAPITTATARSTTLPFMANSLNSLNIPIILVLVKSL